MRLGSGPCGLSGTSSGSDMAFRMEFSAVPEPASLVLLVSAVLGFVVMGLWRSRRATFR